MTSSRRACHRGGFSLLEVMGAVALLGLMFTIAASLAMTTVVREGTAMRRMEAAMIADEEIARMEALTISGSAPEDTSDEREEGEFIVEIIVYPIPLPTIPLGDPSAGGALGVGFDIGSQLGIPANSLEGLLKQIDVRVSWIDGNSERSVSRTTYAFDLAAWAAIAPETPGGSAAGGGSGDADSADGSQRGGGLIGADLEENARRNRQDRQELRNQIQRGRR